MAGQQDILRVLASGPKTGREIADELEIKLVGHISLAVDRLEKKGVIKVEQKLIRARMLNYYSLTGKPYTISKAPKYKAVIKQLRDMIEDLIDDPAADTTLRAKKLLRETEQ